MILVRTKGYCINKKKEQEERYTFNIDNLIKQNDSKVANGSCLNQNSMILYYSKNIESESGIPWFGMGSG